MTQLHKDISDLLNDFRIQLGEILPNKFYGLYLYNSVAMGNFESQYSDVDFVVLLKATLSDDEFHQLKTIHKKYGLEHKYGTKLDGMYLQYDDLGKMNDQIAPYPYVAHACLHEPGYYDINYVTWWSLKEYEMAIDSPSIRMELKEISFDMVVDTMRYNLNDYWLPKLERPELFKEDMWVEFGVVTLARIIYTLEDKQIKSKSESCHYILETYWEWTDIIEEALAIRQLSSKSIIEDIEIRKERTIKFIDAMIGYGNTLLGAFNNE